MKKLLALNLALVLALGLCVPALAAEEETLDPFYTVDGEPVEDYETPPMMDEDYSYDPVAAYEREHPGELENLDVDALIAGWGYEDMTAQEVLLRDYSYYGGTVEEVVKRVYIEKRENVEYFCREAEAYKESYPELWEDFDADAYFAETFWAEGGDKAEHMARWNLLTDEEFAGMMFYWYIWDELKYPDDYDDDWDWDYGYDDAEPTLTLVVNGEASDVVIAANDWTAYADAADLRAILGDEAVGQGYEGPVPIREAAENMGWDVTWYDGGWLGVEQQVCLWDKEAFLAEIRSVVEPLETLEKALTQCFQAVSSDKGAVKIVETATLNIKRFNTLDGDETYTVKLRGETIRENQVLDGRYTLEAAELVDMFSPYMAQTVESEGPGVKVLRDALTDCQGEVVLDYNTGKMAYRIPLLGLMDKEQAGWQSGELSEAFAGGESQDRAVTIYEDMLERSTWDSDGGVGAWDNMELQLLGLAAVAGPDNVKVTGDTVAWTLETGKLNAQLAQYLETGGEDATAFFKKLNGKLTVDGKRGTVDFDLDLRPDTYGIYGPYYPFLPYSLFGYYGTEMELTLSGRMDKNGCTLTAKLHQKNNYELDLSYRSTLSPTTQKPRQIKDVERLWVEPAPGTVLTHLETTGAR